MLDPATRSRLFDATRAFDHPFTLVIVLLIPAMLIGAGWIIWAMGRAGRLSDETRAELRARLLTWVVLAAVMVTPVLLGAAWFMLGVTVLALLLYREYARLTGLFRERAISLTIVLGILAVSFASLDHWYNLFVALPPLFLAILAAVALLADRPEGYVQRVALGILGFAFFGAGLHHLAYMGNDPGYRPIVLLIVVAVELNDIFAYLCGKTFGRRKLCPRTSPNKTVGGGAGALVLTTVLVAAAGAWVFDGQAMDHPVNLLALGLIVAAGGQLGDLMLSSIKRDIGVKDVGSILPGHGGLLDRFDSLLLVAPATFHFIGYVQGFGLDEPVRILTWGS